MNLSLDAETFAKTLGEQLQLLNHLVTLGHQQHLAITADRVSELLALLATKQPMLDRLSQIRHELRDSAALIQSDAFWTDSTLRENCRVLKEQIASAFESVIELEGQCERSLVNSREQIRQRIESLDSGRAATNAYQSNASAVPRPRVDFSSIG